MQKQFIFRTEDCKSDLEMQSKDGAEDSLDPTPEKKEVQMDSGNHTARLSHLSPAKRALLELKLRQHATGSSTNVTILRRAIRDSAPLSFAQQRLWFINQLEPESSAYNEAAAFRLDGSLNVDALQRSFNAIVERHEVLRTTFSTNDRGEPAQHIEPPRAVDLPVHDLSRCPDPEREAAVDRAIAELQSRTFDLGRDLMLRAGLLRLGVQCHVLVVVKHHIASDGWSGGVFWRELSAYYAAFVRQRPSALPELPVQYADYAV